MEEVKKENVEAPKQPNMVESATAAANRLKEENDRMAAHIARLEELKAFETLGGKSQGAAQVEPPKEVSNAEYAKQVLAGKIPQKK